jgi:hypothetical protein
MLHCSIGFIHFTEWQMVILMQVRKLRVNTYKKKIPDLCKYIDMYRKRT